MDKIQWHVLGAGSVGCLWAANLCKSKHAVQMILKDQRLEKLPDYSAILTLRHQTQTSEYDVSLTSPEKLDQPISRLVICTKAKDALAAITNVAHQLDENSRVLLLQNGMGSQQAIVSAFPHLNIWAGSTTDGAYLNDAFDVLHAGKGRTLIGALTSNARPDDFQTLTSNFHLDVSVTEKIENQLWKKLAINCCINGLTALFNCRNGELLDNGERQQWLDQLITETSLVMSANHLDSSTLQNTIYRVCHDTAENWSSTCQDARMKRPTELPYINQYLINNAETLDVPVDAHRHLMTALDKKGIY